MQALSVRRAGGAGALLVAVCTVSFTCFALLIGPDAPAAGGVPWMAVAADYALVLVGLFGLAVVPAVTERVAPLSPGWMRWTSSLAQLGFAVLAVVSVWQAEYELTMNNASLTLPGFSIEEGAVPAAGAAGAYVDTHWQELYARAPKGWLEVAAVGLWMFSVGWLARDSDLFPEDLNSVGRVAGGLSFCVPLGVLFQIDPLLMLGLSGSLVMNPLWFGWTGLVLLRNEQAPAFAFVAPFVGRRAKQLAHFFRLRRDRGPAPRPEVPAPPVDSSLQ